MIGAELNAENERQTDLDSTARPGPAQPSPADRETPKSPTQTPSAFDESLERHATGFRSVSDPTPAGSAAADYPETNLLIPLDHHGTRSGTPATRSIAVRLERSTTSNHSVMHQNARSP
jgi:hypothetical protein